MEGVINTPSIFLKTLLEKFQSDIDNFFVFAVFAHSDIQNLAAVFVHIDGSKLSNIRNINPVIFIQYEFKDIFEEIIQLAEIFLMINSHAQREMIIIIKNNDVSRVIVFVKLIEKNLHIFLKF